MRQSPTYDCAEFTPRAISPLSTESGVVVYVSVDEEQLREYLPQRMWAESPEGIVVPLYYRVGESVFYGRGLVSGTSYSLKYLDGCGNIRKSATISAGYTPGNRIMVSNTLFDLLADEFLGRSPSLATIYDQVAASSEIDDYEKAAFLQQYVLGGKAVAGPEFIYSEVHVPSSKNSINCNCTEVASEPFIRGGIIFGDSPISFLRYTLGQTYTENQWFEGPFNLNIPENRLEFQLYNSGAAKLWWLRSGADSAPSGDWQGGMVGGINTGTGGNESNFEVTVDNYINDGVQLPVSFSNNTMVRMQLVCNGGNSEVPECDCSKEVRSYFNYHSWIRTSTSVNGRGTTRRAVALAEDIGFGYILKYGSGSVGDSMTLVAGVQSAMDNRCFSAPNPAFWSSLASLVIDVAAFAATVIIGDSPVGIDSTEFLAVQGALIDDIQEEVEDVFTEPARIRGDCNTGDTGINGFSDFESDTRIRPGQIVEFGIASRARAAAMGMREYSAEAMIKSYYGLVVMQPYGKGSSNDREECCTPDAEAIYMSRTIEAELPVAGGESLISTRALRSDIAANIIVLGGSSVYTLPDDPFTGRPTVPTDWGRILLPTDSRDGCKLPQGDDDIVIGPTDGNCSDCLTNDDEVADVSIFSTDGRLIATLVSPNAKSSKQEFKVTSMAVLARDRLRQSGALAGLYLVSYLDRSVPDRPVRKTTKIMYVR